MARVASLVVLGAILGLCGLPGCGDGQSSARLLNVSYDSTREFYEELNAAFRDHWKKATGQAVKIVTSHGGSGKQARAVIDGQDASVVTLALAYDIDTIASKADLLPADWQKRLPNNSSPYTSTIVFLVRSGNPKQIRDWDDLVKPGVEVITPHPKTSGGARWNFLAAWGYVLKRELGDLAKIKDPAAADAVAAAGKKAEEFVGELFRHVIRLDAGARGATTCFVRSGQGDVLLVWENEAFLAVAEQGADKFEIVVPSISILAEPPVAVVDKVVDKQRTRKLAEAYLEYLYTPEGQAIAAKNHYRPGKPETVDPKLVAKFPKVELFTIDDVFGGWAKAQKEFFDDGGAFDRIYQPK